MRSSVTGSTSAAFSTGPAAVSTIRAMSGLHGVDEQGPGRVHGRGVPGQDERGRVHLGDDRGTGDDVAGPQRRAVVDVGGDRGALDVDGMPVDRFGRTL